MLEGVRGKVAAARRRGADDQALIGNYGRDAAKQSPAFARDVIQSYRCFPPGAGLKILRGQPCAGSRLRRFGYRADWSGEMHRSDRCQTTANHDRTGPITTDLDSNKTRISRGYCCVMIDGDRP